MSDLYKTSDGKVFDSRIRAEDHQKDVDNLNRASAEYAKMMAKIINHAWDLINSENYQGAIAYLDEQKNSHGKDPFDGYNIPLDFMRPFAHAYAGTGNLTKAIEYITEALNRYGNFAKDSDSSMNQYLVCLLDRVYYYALDKQWKPLQIDAESLMNREYPDADDRYDYLGKAFYYRGLCFENTGKQKAAITDYKTASNYNNDQAKDKLNGIGINYTSKKPSKTLKGNWLLAIVLPSILAFAAIGIAYLLPENIELPGILFILVAALWFFVLVIWRKLRYKVYPLKKKIIALIIFIFTLVGLLGYVRLVEKVIAELV